MWLGSSKQWTPREWLKYPGTKAKSTWICANVVSNTQNRKSHPEIFSWPTSPTWIRSCTLTSQPEKCASSSRFVKIEDVASGSAPRAKSIGCAQSLGRSASRATASDVNNDGRRNLKHRQENSDPKSRRALGAFPAQEDPMRATSCHFLSTACLSLLPQQPKTSHSTPSLAWC